jgi:hypothetical protein
MAKASAFGSQKLIPGGTASSIWTKPDRSSIVVDGVKGSDPRLDLGAPTVLKGARSYKKRLSGRKTRPVTMHVMVVFLMSCNTATPGANEHDDQDQNPDR